MKILEVYKTKYFDNYGKEEEQEEMLKAKTVSLITFHHKEETLSNIRAHRSIAITHRQPQPW